jgi:hypothetical protein
VTVHAAAGSISSNFPVGIAVNVLSNTAKTTVNGKLTAGGKIRVAAEGTTDAEVSASKGNQKSLSGGYLGVDVALQDVQAVIGPNAQVKAGGGLVISSVANEKVNTQVVAGEAAANKDNAEAHTTVADSKKLLRKTATQIKTSLQEKIEKSKINATVKSGLKKGLDPVFNALEKLVGITVPLTVDEDMEDHGEVKVVNDTKTDPETGYDVQVTVTPKDGYKVARVWYSYLDNRGGLATDWTAKDAVLKDGTWQFIQPTEATVIHVEYEKIEEAADNGQNNNQNPNSGNNGNE